MLSEMGFDFAGSPEEADFILFNTCAVREHAQDRVFGNVGALKNIKRRHPAHHHRRVRLHDGAGARGRAL